VSAVCISTCLLGCANQNNGGPDAGQPDAALTLVQQGQALVGMFDCWKCHAANGQEGGVLSGQMNPVPGTMAYGANLTSDPNTGIGGWSADYIARAIRMGIDNMDMPLCPTMPRFATLTDAQVTAIAAYLLSLAPVVSNIPNSICGGGVDGGTTPDGGTGPAPDGGPIPDGSSPTGPDMKY
jgi:mono/diheme cytochrome c family protein